MNFQEHMLKSYIDQIFSKYDKDNSGTLDVQQMTAFFNDLFKSLNMQVVVNQQQAMQAIKAIDSNYDGAVNRQELFTAFKAMMNPQPQQPAYSNNPQQGQYGQYPQQQYPQQQYPQQYPNYGNNPYQNQYPTQNPYMNQSNPNPYTNVQNPNPYLNNSQNPNPYGNNNYMNNSQNPYNQNPYK